MKRFTVCLGVHVEKYIEVEASSEEEEAKRKALNSDDNNFPLCHHCSNRFELSDHTGDV